jgi:hypothetical protein
MIELDLAEAFRTVIADARAEAGGTRSAFDNDIAIGDSNPATLAVDNAIYRLANSDDLRSVLSQPADDPTEHGTDMRLWPEVLRQRRLREALAPQMQEFVADCKGARYTGWSKEHGGPIRRVDDRGRNYYPEESPNPPAQPIR